jgi:spore coat protein A, manganese oxidase
MGLTRRTAIKLGVAIGGLSPLGWLDAAIANEHNQPDCPKFLSGRNNIPKDLEKPAFSPQIKRFTLPLAIPDVLPPKIEGGVAHYTIEIKEGLQEYRDVELETGEDRITLKIPYRGYEGLFPGPTMIQKEGQPACVRFINRLPKIVDDPIEKDSQGCFVRPEYHPSGMRQQVNDAVIHLHGMNSQPYYDGYALDVIPPNYYKDYSYPNDEAGTFWYHDHALDHTAENVHRGLAGMYLVQNEQRDQKELELPSGTYDIPLMLQDREFEPDPAGDARVFTDRVPFNNHCSNSFYGDVICVNGVPFPYLEVERRQYRFRILNASPSRHFRLALSQPKPTSEWDHDDYQIRRKADKTVGGTITVIGNDQDLLPEPVPVVTNCRAISIGMAERYEVIIDFSGYQPGEAVFLRNVGATGMQDSDDRASTIMQFRIMNSTPESNPLQSKLNEKFVVLDPKQSVQTRRFRFEQGGGMWVINGKGWSEHQVVADPHLMDYEIWEFVNPGSGWIHPVHPHLVKFQILSRNGRKPPCHQRGWKDVVMVHEFETVRVLMRFKPHMGRYMMHCHNLVHEDHMMMTQFDVFDVERDAAGQPIKGADGKLKLIRAEKSPGAESAKPITSPMPALKYEPYPEEVEDKGDPSLPCERKPSC